MIPCTACKGTDKDCTVCEGFGRAPGCETCQHIPDDSLPTNSAHTCDCGVMWGLDTKGVRYWVAPLNLSELRAALRANNS